MCCESENNVGGNFTYVAYATDLNGSNFSLNRTADAIKRCYQAIYVSAVELDVTLSTFQNFFFGRYYNICVSSGDKNYYLPTPMIAKRKRMPKYMAGQFDSIGTRNTTIEQLNTIVFPEQYYIEQLDIYFNSFGKENNWLAMPDKQLELCLVSNKSYKAKKGKNSTTELDLGFQGNKDRFNNAIVHPSNTNGNELNSNITDTIFSGGNGSSFSRSLTKTEWKINENDYSFGESIFFNSGLNRFNNPNITIRIDVRELLLNNNIGMPLYPNNFDQIKLKVRNIGNIKYNDIHNKVFKRNSVLYFRLSCGTPGTLNAKTGVYQKRIFSDLSIPVYISPKINKFNNDAKTSTSYMLYGHTLTLGSKK